MGASNRLLGREAELREADVALERALAGQGTALLVTGEAGIGKSSVLEAIAELARRRGFEVAWGRAWEVGGAPSFWPWMQIFAALGCAWQEPLSSAADAAARFAHYDRVAIHLTERAAEAPLVLLLDDVHAADEASVLLLLFLVQRLATQPVVIVAAAREGEVRDAAVFANLARHARCLGLRRLTLGEVVAMVGDERRAAELHVRSEGLPLFLDELIRVGPASTGAHRIGAVLDAHLGRLDPEARAVVELAAVVGRRFRLEDVVEEAAERDGVAKALGRAVDAGVVRRAGDGEHELAHVLLRDRLYDAMEPSRREAQHDRVGRARAEAGALPTALHHLRRGARRAPEELAQLALAAGRQELSALAFEAAAALATDAMGWLPADGPLGVEAALLRANALMAGGVLTEGREEAARAHGLAAARGDADAMARAALTYGGEVFTGRADARLAQLIESAIDAGPSASWHPRLLARLAAARIPPRSEEEGRWAIRAAEEAVERARAHGDLTVLLETLRHAASASGYMIPRDAQIAQAEETLGIAVTLGRSDYIAELAGFVYAVRAEAGRDDAEEALALLEPAIARLGGHQRWRGTAARASRAIFAGDFAEARRLADELARQAADVHGPGARVASTALDVGLHAASDGSEPLRDDFVHDEYPPLRLFRAWVLATRGRREEAIDEARALVTSPGGYPQHILAGVTCALVGDAELAALVRPRLAPWIGVVETFFGPGGVYCAGPTSWVVADLDRLLGDEERALAGYRRALTLCEPWRFHPLIATLRERIGRAPSARARALPAELRLARDGELWALSADGRALGHLPDVKGMTYLSMLLDQPGRDLHVLELVGAKDRTGDAGPLLDAQAVATYRDRIYELRSDLEEAEAWGDLGRREAAQNELQSLQSELARALGLGGRTRLAGSQLERARINVQRRLKDAVGRVTRLDRDSGAQIDRCLRTGTTCCYRP